MPMKYCGRRVSLDVVIVVVLSGLQLSRDDGSVDLSLQHRTESNRFDRKTHTIFELQPSV